MRPRRLTLRRETVRALVVAGKREPSAAPSHCRCSDGLPCTGSREGCP